MHRLTWIGWIGACSGIVVIAAGVWMAVRSHASHVHAESAAMAFLIEDGRELQEAIAEIVEPALARTRAVAHDPRTAEAMASGDRAMLTQIANDAVSAGSEIDALALFDSSGRITAINTIYASGGAIDGSRVDRVLSTAFEERAIIRHCARNDTTSEVMEFQTTCDITPALFDSTGLSVAISVPVVDPSSLGRIGVVSSRLVFDRLTALIDHRKIAGREHAVRFITDAGGYFSEEINSGAMAAPIAPEDVARLMRSGRATPGGVQIARVRDQVVAIMPLHGFQTLEGGGIHVMMLGSDQWISHEVRQARAIAGAAIVIGALVTLLGASASVLAAAREHRQRAERALADADAASLAKSQFLANMSHEIRTPLNGVVGLLDLLLGSDLDAHQRRYARMAKNSAALLTSILGDVLDLSKIEAGKLEMSPVDFNLHDAIEDVLDMHSHPAVAKGLELVCRIDADVPIIVRADPDRLRQVLVNLVNNAIKFTDRGSVVVRVTPESSSPGHAIVRFTVSDTGTGIAPDRLHRLFKAFSQADASTTRAYGGTGLGLVISKQISELMGGRIGVESEHGRGSTFWFTIDFAVPAAPAAPPAWATVDPRNLRILAVDDSPVQRDALMHQLGVWGLRASAVESGDAALEAMLEAAAGGDPYRVALVDRDMPEMDGAELAMAARSRKELRGVVMMAMLTAEDAIEPDRLRAMGFSGFMSKPIRQSQLLDAIMDAIAASDRHAAPPVRATEVSAKTVGCPACPPVACLRILIAEDNEVNQIVTREVLTRSGYQCTVVPDGRAAVEHARSGLCDLVLMDCQMPVMDGFEATREIRKLEAAGSTRQRIPIIALTANAMKEDRQRCIDAGMDAYASKPINPGELLETINRTVRLVQQAAAAA